MRAPFPPLSQECVAQQVRVRKAGGVRQGAHLFVGGRLSIPNFSGSPAALVPILA